MDLSTSNLYFQTVYANSTVLNALCRQNTQQRIITGPIGCSNIATPTSALNSANCISNEIDVELQLNILLVTWYLSKTSSKCYALGIFIYYSYIIMIN
jgi:hypothetical protein